MYRAFICARPWNIYIGLAGPPLHLRNLHSRAGIISALPPLLSFDKGNDGCRSFYRHTRKFATISHARDGSDPLTAFSIFHERGTSFLLADWKCPSKVRIITCVIKLRPFEFLFLLCLPTCNIAPDEKIRGNLYSLKRPRRSRRSKLKIINFLNTNK